MNTNAKRTVMRLVAGVAAVATLMGTAACGSSNSSSSDDNTLTVSYWDDEMQPIKDFIKANPDIKVKQIRVPGDDYNTNSSDDCWRYRSGRHADPGSGLRSLR